MCNPLCASADWHDLSNAIQIHRLACFSLHPKQSTQPEQQAAAESSTLTETFGGRRRSRASSQSSRQ